MKPIKDLKYLTIALYTIGSALLIYSGIQLLGFTGLVWNKVWEFFGFFWGGIKPLLIGLIFAYLLDPLVCFYEKRCCLNKKRTVPLFLALFTLILLMGLFLLVLFLHTAPALGKQEVGRTFWELKENMHTLEKLLIQMDEKAHQWGILQRNGLIQTIYHKINTTLSRFSQSTLKSLKNSIAHFVNIGIGIVISAYLLRDKIYFLTLYRQIINRLLPLKIKERFFSIGEAMNEVFSGYIRGQLLDAVIMTFLISISLTLIGLDFAIIIGVVSGIFNIIPYFGPLVGLALGGIVGFIGNDPRKGVYALLCIGVLQQIDGWFIVPRIMQKAINIHPVLVILSLYVGGKYFGIAGILLGVPVSAFICEVFYRWSKEKQQEVS